MQESGLYALKLYLDGVPREIVVDDLLPYDSHKEQWAFSRSGQDLDGKEIWVQLLEKAWAKIYGSYQRIEAGDIGEAFTTLTGAPTHMFNHEDYADDPEKLWKFLETGDSRGYLMTTAVASGQEAKYDSKGNQVSSGSTGLVDAHAYSIIAAVEVNLGSKSTTLGMFSLPESERLVLIRNPWGFREWSGDWSDSSELWQIYPHAK